MKVQSLLSRIGKLEAPPVVAQGARGLEATARFLLADSVDEAVRMLHGTDLRTEKEKKAVDYRAPTETERFWLQRALAAGSGAAAGSKAPAAAARKRPVIPTGVYLSPLPPSWGTNDVQLIAAPYGSVVKVRMEALANGQQGAYIDYQSDGSAKGALAGLDNLALMGTKLRCVMQEAPEVKLPAQAYAIFVDELSMPSRPDVQPLLDNRELFVQGLPLTSRSEDTCKAWLSGLGFAELKDAVLLSDPSKAYVKFRTHAAAVGALAAINASGAQVGTTAAWSESERILQGTGGSYGLDILRRLSDPKRLQEICQALGAMSLSVGRSRDQFHLTLKCEDPSSVLECRSMLSADLLKAHDLIIKEVQGAIVLKGFPMSWSEKGLKFVFAPFGGLASVLLEDESNNGMQANGSSASSSRRAYVKLRNASGTAKAVTSLHQTKVGDGDLVEESIVNCHRWHLKGWSDGTFYAGIFIDQLAFSRRPCEASPGGEDRELFVRNLPLQEMNQDKMREYFEGFGEVEDMRLLKDTFSDELLGEGYVRFKSHKDARRCMDALTPEDEEVNAKDLVGQWSESERALQRKNNVYRFNLIAELVGQDGTGLAKLKQEAKLQALWVLAESLKQKDRHSPEPVGRQLQFVGRFTDEAHVQLLKELLEKALEEAHSRISERLVRRKKKEKPAGEAGGALNGKAAPGATPWSAPAAGTWSTPAPPGAWSLAPGAPPPASAPPSAWFGAGPPAPMPGQAVGAPPPPGYPGAGPPWGAPPGAIAPVDARRDAEPATRSRSANRRRRRGNGGDRDPSNDQDRRKRSASGSGGRKRRRRRRDRSGSGAQD
eukprot:TRINITY_DN4419_c0_g1_i1.p1 TRINITY_DN4419_c0_g1~~TRINITY_DN4419_c0_g1_i1.p1  ORF type:complete len:829 (-),score=224.90 TRINITY_DN4419_c0_g1_i1:77-2563(-)